MQQVQGVERTMREITTINQMISTAVMQQAEMIETLYNNAVDATQVCVACSAIVRVWNGTGSLYAVPHDLLAAFVQSCLRAAILHNADLPSSFSAVAMCLTVESHSLMLRFHRQRVTHSCFSRFAASCTRIHCNIAQQRTPEEDHLCSHCCC